MISLICHTNYYYPIDSADVWLTVPAAWDAKGCDLMREAAIHAGLVQSSRAGDTQWRDRLHIITEPEAAAVHWAHLTDLHHLQPSQNFIVCDAGGGTVDLAVYKVNCLCRLLDHTQNRGCFVDNRTNGESGNCGNCCSLRCQLWKSVLGSAIQRAS